MKQDTKQQLLSNNSKFIESVQNFFLLTGLDVELADLKAERNMVLSKDLFKLVDNAIISKEKKEEMVDYFSDLIEEVKNEEVVIKNPSDLPDPSNIIEIKEPFVKVEIISPEVYTGKIIELINEKRGICSQISALSMQQIQIIAELPLAEIIVDFYDELKSMSRGYASMSYDFLEYRAGNLVKIDILLNGKVIHPLAVIRDKTLSETIGREVCAKLKESIPRQQIEVAIQAAIGSRIIARETIKPFRKDVTAKLYGGDISRRKKLLDKQKEGKKRMKAFGSVEVPKDVFLKILQK